MKLSSTWYASILIASALLLSAGNVSSGNEEHQNQAPAHERSSKDKSQVPTPSFTIIVQPAPVQIIQPSPAVEQKKPAQKWYQRPSITDWGILGVTLAYAFISLGLLNATRTQAGLAKQSADTAKESTDAAKASVEIAKNTMVLAHRAALGIKGIHFVLSANSTMIVFIENFGRIAASEIRIQIRTFRNTARPDSVDWSRMMPPDENRLTEGEIMPGVPHPIPITSAFLPDDQIQAIRNKTQYIYLSGRIVYDDGSGTDRMLLVRFAYEADSGNWLTIFV
jgi:hypothetical protein